VKVQIFINGINFFSAANISAFNYPAQSSVVLKNLFLRLMEQINLQLITIILKISSMHNIFIPLASYISQILTTHHFLSFFDPPHFLRMLILITLSIQDSQAKPKNANES